MTECKIIGLTEERRKKEQRKKGRGWRMQIRNYLPLNLKGPFQ
jgi:hypothetical protein